jgi:hypothetical protein
MGEPSAGGSIHSETVQDHQAAIVRPIVFRLAVAGLDARVAAEQRPQQLGLVRVHHHRKHGLGGHVEIRAVILREGVVRRQAHAQDSRRAAAKFERGFRIGARRQLQAARPHGYAAGRTAGRPRRSELQRDAGLAAG